MPLTAFLIKATGEAHPLHGNNARLLQLSCHTEQLFEQGTFFEGRNFGETGEHWVGEMGGLSHCQLARFGQVNGMASAVQRFGLPLDEAFLFERFHGFADGGLGQAELLGEIGDLAFFVAVKLDENQDLDLYRTNAQYFGFFPEQYPETLAEAFEQGDDFQVGVAGLGLWVKNAGHL